TPTVAGCRFRASLLNGSDTAAHAVSGGDEHLVAHHNRPRRMDIMLGVPLVAPEQFSVVRARTNHAEAVVNDILLYVVDGCDNGCGMARTVVAFLPNRCPPCSYRGRRSGRSRW